MLTSLAEGRSEVEAMTRSAGEDHGEGLPIAMVMIMVVCTLMCTLSAATFLVKKCSRRKESEKKKKRRMSGEAPEEGLKTGEEVPKSSEAEEAKQSEAAEEVPKTSEEAEAPGPQLNPEDPWYKAIKGYIEAEGNSIAGVTYLEKVLKAGKNRKVELEVVEKTLAEINEKFKLRYPRQEAPATGPGEDEAASDPSSGELDRQADERKKATKEKRRDAESESSSKSNSSDSSSDEKEVKGEKEVVDPQKEVMEKKVGDLLSKQNEAKARRLKLKEKAVELKEQFKLKGRRGEECTRRRDESRKGSRSRRSV